MMEKENRFLLLLAVMSLVSMAVFQGTQLIINRYNNQVLGISSNWSNMFSGMFGGNRSGSTGVSANPPPAAMPTGFSFDQNGWQGAMNGVSGNKQRMFAQGIPCDMAESMYDLFCTSTGDTLTKDEIKGVVPTIKAQNDPRQGQTGDFLDQYLPNGIPKPSIGAGVGQGMMANGLSCTTIRSLLDGSYCSDGYLSKEEIREVVGTMKPSVTGTRTKPRVTIGPVLD